MPAWPSLDPRDLIRPVTTGEPPFPLNVTHPVYSYVARNLIYQLVRALALRDGETVLVPDYHHGNEVRALRAAGASLRFYHIDRALEPDLEELSRLCASGARVLFVIHYLGWPQPVEEMAALCKKHGLILIEDCALSLFSAAGGRPLGSFGDYAVFCLYKTLPLPNGALLVQNGKVLEEVRRLVREPCDSLSTTGRSLELVLGWIRSRSDTIGKGLFALKRAAGRALTAGRVARLPVGGEGFDGAKARVAMAPLSHRLLKRLDYSDLRRRRRLNFQRLQERLGGFATPLPRVLNEGVCPLFFPLLVPDKGAAARALGQRGIEAVEFWNRGDPEAERLESRDCRFLRDHLLELPVHQDLTPEHMDYVAEQVLALDLHL